MATVLGIITLNADGSLDYTPTTNYVGPDWLTYQADGRWDRLCQQPQRKQHRQHLHQRPIQSAQRGVSIVPSLAGAPCLSSNIITDAGDSDPDSLYYYRGRLYTLPPATAP